MCTRVFFFLWRTTDDYGGGGPEIVFTVRAAGSNANKREDDAALRVCISKPQHSASTRRQTYSLNFKTRMQFRGPYTGRLSVPPAPLLENPESFAKMFAFSNLQAEVIDGLVAQFRFRFLKWRLWLKGGFRGETEQI